METEIRDQSGAGQGIILHGPYILCSIVFVFKPFTVLLECESLLQLEDWVFTGYGLGWP